MRKRRSIRRPLMNTRLKPTTLPKKLTQSLVKRSSWDPKLGEGNLALILLGNPGRLNRLSNCRRRVFAEISVV